MNTLQCTPLALRFASLTEDEESNCWMRKGQKRQGVCLVCGCGTGLLASCWPRTVSARLDCCHPPGLGQWRGPWSWDRGGGGGLGAQEVELEAEAEAVVVLGPRSVLLPSMGTKKKPSNSRQWFFLKAENEQNLNPFVRSSYSICLESSVNRVPEVAEALVGVKAAAWLRAWAGMRMEAKEGLLDNSKKITKRKKLRN